jgi:hypothetical protein
MARGMGFLLGSDPARGIGINLLPVLGHFDRLTERGKNETIRARFPSWDLWVMGFYYGPKGE